MIDFIKTHKKTPAFMREMNCVHRATASKVAPQPVLYSTSNTTGFVPTVPISLRQSPVRLFETLARQLRKGVLHVKVRTLNERNKRKPPLVFMGSGRPFGDGGWPPDEPRIPVIYVGECQLWDAALPYIKA